MAHEEPSVPPTPGFVAMPTTLLNAALGLLPDRSWAVLGQDRIGAVVPMFDEEAGAAAALASLLAQSDPVDEVVVSINGGRDATSEVVDEALIEAGYRLSSVFPWGGAPDPLHYWRCERGGPLVTVVRYAAPTSKADSVNAAVAAGLVSAERVLVMDGDTVLDPGFVQALRQGQLRLSRGRVDGRAGFVLEDIALQSGVVSSRRPSEGGAVAGAIHAARQAEYAFATLLRRGQCARRDGGRLVGATRLLTVVGCGFAARRDAFPMPADTRTEDHDLTLTVQAGEVAARTVDVADLAARGLQVVVDGVPRPIAEVVGDAPVEWRTTPHARLEPAAAMATDDPLRLATYLAQVERWAGGGLESLVKRTSGRAAWADVPANVRFAALTAQLENLAGLALWLALPWLLGLGWTLAGPDRVAHAAALWLGLDLLLTSCLVFGGAWLQMRARGVPRRPAWRAAAARTARGLLPLVLLRPLHAVAYLAALVHTLRTAAPRLRARPTVTVTWERPRAVGARRPRRIAAAAAAVAALGIAGSAGSAVVSAWLFPVEVQLARHAVARPPFAFEEHAGLPVRHADRGAVVDDALVDDALADDALADAAPVSLAGLTGQRAVWAPPAGTSASPPAGSAPNGASVSAAPGPSRVCVAADRPGAVRRTLDAGAPASAGPVAPLSPWGLVTLARLAPLLALLEEAATRYDLPADLLLQVLLNESYLDPLAVGPTDDLGLSQMTEDALVLLHGLSTARRSPFANARLFAEAFDVFDPDFSLCAGAAKLAWVRQLPGGEDDRLAYARYVNPLDGVVGGRVSARHAPLVTAFEETRPMVDALVATVAAYRVDPRGVAAEARALLEVSDAVAAGGLSVAAAYRVVAQRVADTPRIDDAAFYGRVLAELFGLATAPPADDALARAP